MTALQHSRLLRPLWVFWMFRDRVSVWHLNSLYLMSIVLQWVWTIETNMSFLTTIVAQFWGSRSLQLSTVTLFQSHSERLLQFLIHIKNEKSNSSIFNVKDLCKMQFLFSISNWLYLWFTFFQSLQLLCIINQNIVINKEYWHFSNLSLQCRVHFH